MSLKKPPVGQAKFDDDLWKHYIRKTHHMKQHSNELMNTENADLPAVMHIHAIRKCMRELSKESTETLGDLSPIHSATVYIDQCLGQDRELKEKMYDLLGSHNPHLPSSPSYHDVIQVGKETIERLMELLYVQEENPLLNKFLMEIWKDSAAITYQFSLLSEEETVQRKKKNRLEIQLWQAKQARGSLKCNDRKLNDTHWTEDIWDDQVRILYKARNGCTKLILTDVRMAKNDTIHEIKESYAEVRALKKGERKHTSKGIVENVEFLQNAINDIQIFWKENPNVKEQVDEKVGRKILHMPTHHSYRNIIEATYKVIQRSIEIFVCQREDINFNEIMYLIWGVEYNMYARELQLSPEARKARRKRNAQVIKEYSKQLRQKK
jgi:hypothetical protein